MKKYKILISLASIAILIMAAISVFAAFVFEKTITDNDIEAGKINITSKSFLSYANDVDKDNYSSTASYQEALRARAQNPLEITAADNVTAEIDDDGLGFTLKNEYGIIIAIISSVEITDGNIQTALAKSSDGQTNYYVNCLNNILTIRLSENSSLIAKATCTIENNKITNVIAEGLNVITCYATEKVGYADEDTTQFYLNQLGVRFTFNTEIPVYFRIHFEDAWKSKKTYTSGTSKEQYVTKGNSYKETEDGTFQEGKIYYQKSGQVYKQASVTVGSTRVGTYYEESSESAFEPKDKTNWIYDAKTNCAYYKTLFDPSASNTFTADFAIDEGYWYAVANTTAYRESIRVEVSFYVDIVQANRAEKVWDVDFDSLGIN